VAFNITRVITRYLCTTLDPRGYLEGCFRSNNREESQHRIPRGRFLSSREMHPRPMYRNANAVMRELQSDHRVNKNNRLSRARVGYLSVAGSAHLFGQFLRTAKCSDNVCIRVYKRENERELDKFIYEYLRLPEEITVDRDDTCRRIYSLNAHANDIIIL